MSKRIPPGHSFEPDPLAGLDPGPSRGSWVAAAHLAIGRAAERTQLEEMLLATTIHPQGPGFDAAHLLRWDEHSELFACRTRRRGAEQVGLLSLELERARLAASRAVSREPGGMCAQLECDRMGSVAEQAWRTRQLATGRAPEPGAPWSGAHEIGVLPLRDRERTWGLLVAEWSGSQARPDLRRALGELQEFSDLAIEFFERGRERERRAEQAEALQELARSVVTPRNLAEVMHLAVRNAARATGAHGGAAWTRLGDGGLRLDVVHGSPAVRERMGRALHGMAAAAVETLRPRSATPATDEFLLPAEAAAALSGVVIWPLLAYGRAVGAIALYGELRDEDEVRFELQRADVEFLSALSDLLALAVDHSARFAELRESQRREREAVAELRRRERLATLGELAVQASQEAQHPTASIRAFASRAQRGLPDDDARRECLDVVLREVERLERILSEQRAHADLEPASLRVGSLNDEIEVALRDVGEQLVRRRVRLIKNLADDLPPLLLDARRVGQALQNLLGFALDSVGVGGRLRLETRRLPQHVLFELAHDGGRSAGDALDHLFVPFSAGRAGGPTVGLSIAHRIVQQHGGEIRVRAEGEWSVIVTFTLPIGGNQDRRGSRADRRRKAAEAAPDAAAKAPGRASDG